MVLYESHKNAICSTCALHLQQSECAHFCVEQSKTGSQKMDCLAFFCIPACLTLLHLSFSTIYLINESKAANTASTCSDCMVDTTQIKSISNQPYNIAFRQGQELLILNITALLLNLLQCDDKWMCI